MERWALSFRRTMAAAFAALAWVACGPALAQPSSSAPAASAAAARATAAAAASAPEAAAQRIEIRGDASSDTAQRRRDPVAKQIYGREELDRHGDTSVADVLRRLPGVNLQGGNPRLRGLGAGYTLILLNGDPAPPGFSLDNLAPSQVERIEITRGPSAEYSAQAVAGTINIILRQAPRQRQRELRLNLGYYQTQPEPQINGVWGDRVGAVSATLPYALYRWRTGSTTTVDEAARDASGRPREWLSVNTERAKGDGLNLSPRVNWRGADNKLTLDWNAVIGHNRWRNEGDTHRSVLAGSAPAALEEQWRNHGWWRMQRSQVQLGHKGASGVNAEIKLGGERSASHYSNPVVGQDAAGAASLDRLTDGRSAQQSGQISGKLSGPVGDAHRWVAGVELESRQREENRVQLYNGQLLIPAGGSGQDFKAHIRREAAFVQDEWEVSPRWATSLGLRAERITTTAEALASVPAVAHATSRSQVVTPLLHLTYKFDAAPSPAPPAPPAPPASAASAASSSSSTAFEAAAAKATALANAAQAPTSKSRDLLRASLTRSYKAPDLSALIARPSISADYPTTGGNTALVPDSVGNPDLKPELATGLDIAFEKYLAQGGVLSASVFHRRITGLIRKGLALESVPWAAQERWVSRPLNFSVASSSGLELEAKGRFDEWWAAAFLDAHSGASFSTSPALKALNLRASLAVYRSAVQDLPAPHNRLDGQQPWSLTLGADQTIPSTAWSWGGSLAYTPGYRIQQTQLTQLAQGRARRADLYVMWAPDKQTSWRFGAFNLAPHLADSRVDVQDGVLPATYTMSQRRVRTFYNLSLSLKL